MTFALSGTRITQSGTDADLSGLAGIAGVSVEAHGTGDSTKTYYFLGALALTVSGTLDIDPRVEVLVWGSNAANQLLLISNGGTLNVGKEVTTNGYTYATPGVGMIFPNESASDQYAIQITNGGTWNIVGATIQLACGISSTAGSTLYFQDAEVVATKAAGVKLRMGASSLIVNGLRSSGVFSMTFFEAPVLFAGWFPVGAVTAGELIASSSGGTDAEVIFTDFDAAGVSTDFTMWRGADLHFVNLKKSGALTFSLNQVTNGLVRVSKDIALRAVDRTGSGIAGARVFISDYDNGQRAAVIPDSGTDYDLASSKVYTGVSAATGDFPSTRVLTRVAHRSSGPVVTDYRSRTDGPDDVFEMAFAGYGYALQVTSVPLNGEGVREIESVLLEDASVTEPSKATVDAYASIDTAAQFYDRAKAYLIDSFAGEAETLVARTVSAESDSIDAGAFNVVIDSGAAQAFDFDGATLTLRSSEFTGDIATTGTYTEVGATRTIGNVTSSTVDSAVQILNADSWIYYANAADRDVNANAVQTSGDGSDVVRFLYTGTDTFHFRANIGGVGILIDVPVSSAGLTQQALSSDALINAIASQIPLIPSEVHGYDYTANVAPSDSFQELAEKVESLSKLIPAAL